MSIRVIWYREYLSNYDDDEVYNDNKNYKNNKNKNVMFTLYIMCNNMVYIVIYSYLLT